MLVCVSVRVSVWCFKITKKSIKGVMSIKDRAFQKCDIFRDVSPTLLLLSIESTKINFSYCAAGD